MFGEKFPKVKKRKLFKVPLKWRSNVSTAVQISTEKRSHLALRICLATPWKYVGKIKRKGSGDKLGRSDFPSYNELVIMQYYYYYYYFAIKP